MSNPSRALFRRICPVLVVSLLSIAACGGDFKSDTQCKSGAKRICGTSIGTCTMGAETCTDGQWGLCTGTPPAVEICDGLDNDCDGDVDEGFNVGAYCNLPNSCVGRLACAPRMADGGGSMVPSLSWATVCELDLSFYDGGVCSGALGCVSGEARSCGSGLGSCKDSRQICKNGEWGPCLPAPNTEVCDGLDNDCDGDTDEGFGVGASCTLPDGCIGRLACAGGSTGSGDADAASPTWATICALDRSLYDGGVCNPHPTSCVDGGTRSCGSDLGSCKGAAQTCTNGEWGPCSLGPRPELCDGLDNDCDGDIDEGFELGSPCRLPDGRLGRRVCAVKPSDGGVVDAPPSAPATTCELNQSLYDGGSCNPDGGCCGDGGDCDPGADLCIAGEVRSCGLGKGECKGAQQVCMNGRWGLCFPAPEVEVCDGRDNDCDGYVDFTVTSKEVFSACQCVQRPYSFGSAPSDASDRSKDWQAGFCTQDKLTHCAGDDGGLSMEFCLDCLHPSYAMCISQFPMNLVSFVKGNDTNALTVNFSLDSPTEVRMPINLYYSMEHVNEACFVTDEQGRSIPGDTIRRYLNLLTVGDGPGTYTKVFVPRQTCYPKCLRSSGCVGTVSKACSCGVEDTCGNPVGPDCQDLSFSSAHLQVAVEWCGGYKGQFQGTLRIHQVYWGPLQCKSAEVQ